MIQEESTQRTVALMIRTSRLTESVLKKAMIMYLREAKEYSILESLSTAFFEKENRCASALAGRRAAT